MTPGEELLFLALGGSAEIGMNVNLYGTRGKWVMVDLGLTFADSNYPGIDLVLPDLQFIEERRKDLVGIVLTHGHEDHIGAIPYLAADLGVPLYATPFTAGLIRGKLEEEGLLDKVKLHVVNHYQQFDVGPFNFRYMPLAHSIPEGNALVIGTPFGTIFHTGDWKLDDQPLVGTPSTPAELSAVGDEGVLALVCDSTNVFNPESSGSEATVRDGLMDVIGKAKGRVLVTTFASNAARLQTLGEVARATGRQLCVAGRSLDRILGAARAAGYLRDFPETLDFDAIMKVPRDSAMIVATGGQGEARAALARVASDSHPIKLTSGDTVVFSSKQIPGNEVAIGAIQNALVEKGITLITDRQAQIHVSGHPGRPELLAMYGWIRPNTLVPVHGEMRHMAEQARLGAEAGIPNNILQKNGDLVRLAPGKPKIIGKELTGRLVLDGDVILPADGATMAERRRLGLHGQIGVAIAIGKDGKLRGEPEIKVQGVPVEEDKDDYIADALDAVKSAMRKPGKDLEATRESVRLAVRRVATRWTGKKPLVDVLVVTV